MTCPALQFLIVTVAGWLNRKQVAVVEYLIVGSQKDGTPRFSEPFPPRVRVA
jgi:hypothetical protein